MPWEERMKEAREKERVKYRELVEDCMRNGWKTRCMPVEVGRQGFASHSIGKPYGTFDITGARRRKTIRNRQKKSRK